jgi:hypothetical protein
VTQLLPASAATLYYKAGNDSTLTEFLGNLSGQVVNDEWNELTFRLPGGQLRLSKMQFAPGNRMAITTLKILNFLKKEFGKSINEDIRVKDMLRADYSIGMVFDPDINHPDPREEYFVQILKHSGGVVFNGATLVNVSLELLGKVE